MITIGINENVILDKVSMDDKSALEVTFSEMNAVKPKSLFANVAADEVVENTDMSIRIFPPLPPKKEDMTEEKRTDLAVADINKTKGILTHLLKGYFTSDELKGLWGMNVYAGLPIDEANFAKQIQVKEIMEGVHKNMARIFIDKIRPVLAERKPFRLLLVRQSKDKHYATFRGRYIEDNPFFESMDIPKEASKLKFTPWETDQGLTHGIPVSKDAADKKDGGAAGAGGGTQAPLTAQNVFGN